MKILNIINPNNNYLPVYTKTPQTRRVVSQCYGDVVSFSGGQVGCFKKLTSKTLNQLYNAEFVPTKIKPGIYYFPTYVLDKITGKPAEVFVVPFSIDKIFEEFHILDPNNGFKRIGQRIFTYEGNDKSLIYSGSMESDSSRYSGIGVRLHQIAVERMKIKNLKNIEIYSMPEAYSFHKKMGFEPIKEVNLFDKRGFNEFVKESALSLGLDEEAVKKLIVYNEDEFGLYSVEINLTKGNYVDYMYENPSKYKDGVLPYYTYMRLSKDAQADWDKFINKTSIFNGMELPALYKMGDEL